MRLPIVITKNFGLWRVNKGKVRLAINTRTDKPRWASKTTIDDETAFTLPRIHELFVEMGITSEEGSIYDF